MATATADNPSGLSRPHGRRRIWLWLTVLAALVLLLADRRVACGPASGGLLEGAIVRSAGEHLRVGTFNIHGGKGLDGRRDLERTASCLEGLDLIALNEVHGPLFWQQEDQAELLGRRLGMQWLFAPTELRWFHYRFGNGVLTDLPVQSWQRIPLPRRHGRSYRNLVLLTTRFQGVALRALVTHIDRSDDRERADHLRAASELFLALDEPAILLGDLNTSADDPIIAQLLATPGVGDPIALSLGSTAPRRIDWILVRGLETVAAGIDDRGASDHHHIWAELRLPGDRVAARR